MTDTRDVKTWEEQDPQYEAFFKDQNNAILRDLLEGEVSESRERIRVIGAAAPVPNIDDLDMEMIDAGNFQIQLYKLKGSSGKLPVVACYHGGGWIVGSVWNEHTTAIAFARAGFAVANIEYRLAPEHKFPAAAEDAKAALDWVLENADKQSFNKDQIIVYGTSAGGNLAALTAQYARDKSIKLAGQLLRVPSVCHHDVFPKDKYPLESPDADFKDILSKGSLRYCVDTYLGEGDKKDIRMSPFLGKLEELAPAYIEIAGRDPLRDEAIAYAQELRKAGVNVEHRVYNGVPHAFAILPFEQGQRAQSTMVEQAKRMANLA